MCSFHPKRIRMSLEGCNFFNEEYSKPENVAKHIKKGDVVGFCTGSSGRFTLRFKEGYPAENLLAECPSEQTAPNVFTRLVCL